MGLFSEAELDGDNFLVYDKREAEEVDVVTLKMCLNNRIEGLAPITYAHGEPDRGWPASYVYHITGLKTAKEILSETVSRNQILQIMESLADAVLQADNYMLEVSEYVFDEKYIYINPLDMKVSMVVLPIKRQGTSLEEFLKKLLFDAQYDQTEDCRYVASLIRTFGEEQGFSLERFREKVQRLREEKPEAQKRENYDMRQTEDEVEKEDDRDETLMLHPEPEQPVKPQTGEISVRQEHPRQRYLLHRCRTDENFEIRGDIVRVGRSSSVSDICIPGNPGIGRIHVILYVRDGQVFIADNGSKNKTFVDGTELKPEDPPMLLLSGSKIKMSDEEFEFRISR